MSTAPPAGNPGTDPDNTGTGTEDGTGDESDGGETSGDNDGTGDDGGETNGDGTGDDGETDEDGDATLPESPLEEEPVPADTLQPSVEGDGA